MLLFYAPRLRLARMKLAEALLGLEEVRGIALPYPRDMERILNLYAQGYVGWQRVFEEARERMPGYYRSWLWTEEPLIRALPILGARVRCYLPPTDEVFREASELVILAFRVRVTGRVNLDEWRKAIGGERVAPPNEQVTVASVPHEGEGVDVWGLPYPPSELLASGQLTEELVREYVDYVFSYIVHSRTLDEAYLRWLEERKGVRAVNLWQLLALSQRESVELKRGFEQS